ncbi:MAG: helix-turn-helix domain-containing protein [Actinomycetota bacterium]|nr:helix-turn-helix domain-containing protein [Actinomycetota bacterium]
MRARIVLCCAKAGATNRAVAGELRVSEAMVGKWRRRFVDQPGRVPDVLRPALRDALSVRVGARSAARYVSRSCEQISITPPAARDRPVVSLGRQSTALAMAGMRRPSLGVRRRPLQGFRRANWSAPVPCG